MTNKPLVTEESVSNAANALLAQGITITQANVRAALGGGSFSTIQKFLNPFMAARFLHKDSESLERWKDTIMSIEKVAQKMVVESTALLKEEVDRKTLELASSNDEIDNLTSQLDHAQTKINNLNNSLIECQGTIKSLNEQLSKSENTRGDLVGSLDKLNMDLAKRTICEEHFQMEHVSAEKARSEATEAREKAAHLEGIIHGIELKGLTIKNTEADDRATDQDFKDNKQVRKATKTAKD
jgi:chromosome segregation ATPase